MPTTFSSTLQLLHNNLFWGICVAAFRHHFSALQIYAGVLLTDTARLPALSINGVFLSVWLTAAPFMSLTFPAGYWISKHTPACIFCSSAIIKSYTQPAGPTPHSLPRLDPGRARHCKVWCGWSWCFNGGEPLDVWLFCLSLHLDVINVKRENQLPMRIFLSCGQGMQIPYFLHFISCLQGFHISAVDGQQHLITKPLLLFSCVASVR